MKTFNQLCGALALSSVLFAACNSTAQPVNTTPNKEAVTTKTALAPATVTKGPKKGSRVLNSEVCMVNDAYMGKKQIEVPYKGDMFYGCCEMCVERIPKDETVRIATDPQTGEKVNKASAYIILLNEEGSVAYFANEKNYKDFVASHQ
jgi:YHS domain-containing protein